jgi:hypothetical protein
MEQAVRMSKEINRQYGYGSAFGTGGQNDTEITRIGIAFDDHGKTSFFAELEKSGAKQRERIEQAREEKRAGKKAEEKKTQKELWEYSKNSGDTKRTTVQANSIKELLRKM